MRVALFMIVLLRAAASLAQDCISAETADDIIQTVRRRDGTALICLNGDPGRRVDFRTQPRLIVPENGNVTIQCGGRYLDTYSSEGPLQILENAVIGLQGCKVNTFSTLDEAVSAGQRDDAFLAIFGNTVNAVAQVSASELFFPEGFMDLLSGEYLDSIIKNKTAVTLRIGEAAVEADATAVTIIAANYIPGPTRSTNIRFDFKHVTAWHAPVYAAAASAIERAKVQTISFRPEIDFCCAEPVEPRTGLGGTSDDKGRAVTNLIIIILVVVVLALVSALLSIYSVAVSLGIQIPVPMHCVQPQSGVGALLM